MGIDFPFTSPHLANLYGRKSENPEKTHDLWRSWGTLGTRGEISDTNYVSKIPTDDVIVNDGSLWLWRLRKLCFIKYVRHGGLRIKHSTNTSLGLRLKLFIIKISIDHNYHNGFHTVYDHYSTSLNYDQTNKTCWARKFTCSSINAYFFWISLSLLSLLLASGLFTTTNFNVCSFHNKFLFRCRSNLHKVWCNVLTLLITLLLRLRWGEYLGNDTNYGRPKYAKFSTSFRLNYTLEGVEGGWIFKYTSLY